MGTIVFRYRPFSPTFPNTGTQIRHSKQYINIAIIWAIRFLQTQKISHYLWKCRLTVLQNHRRKEIRIRLLRGIKSSLNFLSSSALQKVQISSKTERRKVPKNIFSAVKKSFLGECFSKYPYQFRWRWQDLRTIK